ncbi:MAG: hypothetical protein ACTHK7_00980 [Aureliella sp.]
MPRLSIIIAHQNDQRLENTLLSILENRPRDSEIIVAHDGSYADPYQLADEVLFVETDSRCSKITKLNEALYATCAPVVHILAEGMQVSDGWCEGAVVRIQREQVAAVSPLAQSTEGPKATYAGLDARSLAKRGLQTVKSRVPTHCAAPLLAAGFYSRRMLLGLGGFLEQADGQVADVDLALCMERLELACEVDAQSTVFGQPNLLIARRDAQVAQDLASLLVAHGRVSPGLVSGLKGATGRFIGSLANPSQWAPALAWGIGLTSNRLEKPVAERLASAARSLEAQSVPSTQLNVFGSDATPSFHSGRKAA